MKKAMIIFEPQPNCSMRSIPLTLLFLKKARFYFISFLLFSFNLPLFSQRPDPIITLNNKFEFVKLRGLHAGFVSRLVNIEAQYDSGMLNKRPLNKDAIPVNDVSKKLIARFVVINNTMEKDSIYFFPGMYYRHVLLYAIKDNKLIPFPVIAPPIKDSISYRLFTIEPYDTLTLLAECYPLKTYTNTFRPSFMKPDYVEAFAVRLPEVKKYVSLFTYVLCGLFLMMILFSLANYFQGANREFLYYAAYAFFLGFMLFTKQFYYGRSFERNFFFESYLDFVLQSAGIWFFMLFMLRFLESKKNFPFLYNLYMAGIIYLPISVLVYSYFHFSSTDYYWENLLENVITKNVLLALVILFLIYAVKNWHHKLLRYLFWGNLLFLLFSFFSLFIVLGNKDLKIPGILNDSLVYYELGLLTELIFFLMGLTYKNKTQLIEQTQERERLKTENERKELEKQVAVMQAHQEERERISADIHDELGSGMTTIRLMSEIAKNKLKENVPVEIEKISNSANEVLNKMNAIIWSMNSSNDTLDSLISYIRAYATEYFDATPIECRIKTPETISIKELSGDKRRNIFLCVKETLNNILKHSGASRVDIDIRAGKKLIIRITDNGIGIDLVKIRKFGNGLKNIERRMKAIGGEYKISNVEGTETRIELPL